VQVLRENTKPGSLQVATFMSPLPDETPTRREMIPVPENHADAALPLYLFELQSKDYAAQSDDKH